VCDILRVSAVSAVSARQSRHVVMSTSYTSRAGRRQTARSTLLMYMVHLGRLKAPRKAAGQMDLLTVPSADGVDSKIIQVEEALSASQPSLATAKAILIPQRQTRASSPARDAHGVMPNSRHVPSREQRSTSRKNALCKGFETIMT
jgi:hypothetical protein